MDDKGETHAIARQLPQNIKTKQVRARLGDEANLPGVGEVRKQIADDMLSTMQRFREELNKQAETRRIEFEGRRKALVLRQRTERRNLAEAQERKQAEESRERQARFRKGFKGIWDRVRGEHRRISEENERQAAAAQIRDQKQKETLIQAQISQRRKLSEIRGLCQAQQADQKREIEEDSQRYSELRQNAERQDTVDRLRSERKRATRSRSRGLDGPGHEMEL